MKKRLRKKKHYGEFTEWGRQLVIMRNQKDGFDEFLDAFIEEANELPRRKQRGIFKSIERPKGRGIKPCRIESNGCYCGGGGNEDKLDVVVELGRRSDDPDARLKRITAWLDARPDVQNWRVSEEFDVWHGDFQDIDDKIEQQDSA